jgi:hypothetical protein
LLSRADAVPDPATRASVTAVTSVAARSRAGDLMRQIVTSGFDRKGGSVLIVRYRDGSLPGWLVVSPK